MHTIPLTRITEILASVLKSQGLQHLSLFGSSRDGKLDTGSDIDLLVIVEKLTPAVYQAVMRTSESCCRLCAAELGDQWEVEDRQIPSKAVPESGSRQLQLRLHDIDSLRKESAALLQPIYQRHRKLWGAELTAIRQLPQGLPELISGCIDEIERALISLQRSALPSRRWVCDGEDISLHKEWIPTASPWHKHNLLLNCSALGDRVPIDSLQSYPQLLNELMLHGPIIYTLIKWNLDNWQTLDEQWPVISDTVIQALHQRKDFLASVVSPSNTP